ncbi:RAVE (regulator of V-ATPase assembly) complex subunit RAV1/DMX protein, WD repeat superfamily [Handroanthus impetiginosus]|uniref:RAVE (Regulator of V-ATPase assembly) complex subunit RAV1/DMX protein, WD repeat superfamily n=1 Tax=Handroanthus impetiginosus TaxID=429701 RepID=A0A2G9I461_9LAMI|nr:RAVE (regulator of V-ATPase assembly) complex subunit RAV1/DMX protein, WD repeat superfamily [Handroanthus impetiginosus]
MGESTPAPSPPLPLDITSHLPLQLIKSEIIPPAPSRSEHGSEPIVDFLLDFAGHSWIAYGASSLLVISHFPDPLLDAETKIGPIYRQEIELSREATVYVSAVAWSPSRPSAGEIAVALGDCIVLLTHGDDETSSSSFCWSQTATLVLSKKVEAIKWTGSGDGLISGGIEVVMWKRNEKKSWEIAWSFEPKVPQALVSPTWSVDGLSATAPSSKFQVEVSSSPSNETRKCVLVCQGDSHSKYPQAELHHPMPVSMIQWRPLTGKPSKRHARHSLRPVLLTCCLDGAVRLWGEIDDGRIRKAGKDNSDQKATKLSFCVVTVIEVNQSLNGFLGSDVFVSWATEVEGVTIVNEEVCYYSGLDDFHHDAVGRCEWLIGFGPGRVTTLWATHCLDESAPLRFPRVTLWKKQDFASFVVEASHLLVNKVLMMRTQVSGPPVICSLVQLLPCNSFAWTQLYSQPSTSMERTSANDSHPESPLTACAKGVLEVEGHTGKILQLAIHRTSFEVELAASLDENGMLLFWSFSSLFNSHIGLPTSTPSWKLCGKTSVSDHSPNYMCFNWAPTVLGKDQVLLLGHADGIDCFIVKTLKNDEEEIPLHKLFSIPFRIEGHEQGLSRVCTIPLPSKCTGNFDSSKFLLVALWMDSFEALSWEITIHSHDLQESCMSGHLQTFESDFSGEKYSVSVDPFSSTLPVPHKDDKVTSCAVVCPSDLVLSLEKRLSSDDEMGSCCYAYHMITGCINGSLKLWRSMPVQSLSSDSNWVLVGVLAPELGPILAVSPSACYRKIATASTANDRSNSSALCIWECMHAQSAGSFMLEDKLFFDGEIVALHWLRLGNGQLLLGVCLRNEVRIYASRHCGGQDILKFEKPLEGNAWICIAVNSALPAISDFLWGPKGTAVVVHNEYFSVFSHFLLLSENAGSNKHVFSPSFPGSKESQVKSTRGPRGQYQSQSTAKMNTEDNMRSMVNAESCKQMHNLVTRICFWSMSEIAEMIGGSLPLFHPEALLINLCTGNWKRAVVALRHLVKQLTSINLSKQGHGAKMSSNIIPAVPLSTYLEGLLSPSSSDKLFQWSSSQLQTGLSHFALNGGYDAPNTALTASSSKSEFKDFSEAFERLYYYTHITKVEKMQALSLIDLLQEVSNPHSPSAYESLDEPGRRFWVAVRFQQQYFAQRFNRLPLVEELVVSSDLIGWAFHSDCHDNLLDSLLSTEPSWEEMRSMSVGFWYTNVAQLRVKMERLARQQYMKNKDPKACALLYIALNRLQVLTGLFKISKDDKDKPLAGFLTRNFQEDKNKAAALKNAYVLMGKHQLELAIAFFLLGGDASSAVTVCAKNLQDEQLALVICRLIEGCGGPLERSLISKYLLPSALSKGDFWMASFLEWVLGNYSQSFLRMLGVEIGPNVDISVRSSSHASFLDPSIGQYCLMLAKKTGMKNAIGELNAAVLCRWAILMNVTSFSRCGLALEALECLSSSVSHFGGPAHGSVLRGPTCNFLVEMLKPSAAKSSANWISDEISCHIISHSKLNLAMQYISNLLRGHPSCIEASRPSVREFINHEVDGQEFDKSLKEFQDNLTAAIAYFQQKFSLLPCHLASMIVLSLHYNGLEFIGSYMLQDYVPEFLSQEKNNGPDNLFLCPSNLLMRATEEISSLYVKYMVASCKYCSRSTYLARNNHSGKDRFCWLAAWGFSNQGIVQTFWYLRAMLQLFLRSYSKDFLKLLFTILGLFQCHVLFASAWLQKNSKALLVTVRPILLTLARGSGSNEIKMEDLNMFLAEIVEMIAHDSLHDEFGTHVEIDGQKQEQSGSIPDDEISHITSASLWVHMSRFLEHQLSTLSQVLDGSCSSQSLSVLDCKDNNLEQLVGLVSRTLVEFLKLSCTGISFYCKKQFATYLLQEVNISNRTNLCCLEDGLTQAEHSYQTSGNTKLLDNGKLLDFEQLRHICNDPKIIRGAFLQEYRHWLPYFKQKSSSRWSDAYVSITREFESEESWDKEDRFGSPHHASGSPLACLTPDDHPFKSSSDKDLRDSKKVMPFQNPKEICKRNGELLEALCINSIDQCQAALASNKKGIIFFNWEDEVVHKDKSEHIWGEADWPQNGWAGSQSIPVPTFVSSGVGLGSKKGAHLGLGGATIGAGSLARPGRDLTAGGAFGIPGYAGVGASSLGWGIQEGFDEFLDPPATVDNVRTRAFASHPSRPLFLVGSSNTHIYLWEFGKGIATATYGVLPAANVPPPYALASVSAVRFDHCGHRFVTGALDGTVCTWQLEVGGRSNIHPTESSVCFSNHTADATYVTASGSIVAAAGYSSSGLNVVVWDTLAPPATSRASIMCHEGGARSLAVFDNDIGSGSVSPLILTGGSDGDVGLHDFRYIATGRTKKHKHIDSGEHNINTSSSADMRSKTGDQNRNGMLWYIPKAHSGSVTKICTIPNSSFFLTGSKDGDVKLWDAKKAKLVFHWPRLHERHTFLQPSSHGFGGIVRAGVTDIQVVSHGFLTCGGDGLVKFVRLQDSPLTTTN